MILKTNSGSQEARETQHQHAKEPKKGLAIFRNSWVSFPLHNSLKLHHSTIGPWATKTAPCHFAPSRVLHISQSLSLSPSHPRECCFHLDREKKCSLNCKDGITPPLNSCSQYLSSPKEKGLRPPFIHIFQLHGTRFFKSYSFLLASPLPFSLGYKKPHT